MKHVSTMSKIPAKAQTGICEEFESDLQVKLCFLIQILTSFILPLVQSEGTDRTA